MKEPLLEPVLRNMRLRQVHPYLKNYPKCKLLDIGCGWDAKLIKAVQPFTDYCVGLDFKAPAIKTEKIETLSVNILDTLPFNDASFDFITMLAVMEHLENDEAILNECSRLLRPGGGLLITVPTWHAKPVLEFLSYRLNLINPSEIRDHKRYYSKDHLVTLIKRTSGLKLRVHNYFQWRFNNLVFIQKSEPT